MKALSLSQPWDRVVVLPPYKNVENRTWPTYHRGRIYVHRAKSWDEKGYQWIMDSQLLSAEQMLGLAEIKQDYFGMRLRCGPGIVGEVFIAGCMHKKTDLTASEIEDLHKNFPQYFSPWFFGPYGFVLVEPKAYAAVIPYRGMPGLFEVNSLE
jgi:hypothetical protein